MTTAEHIARVNAMSAIFDAAVQALRNKDNETFAELMAGFRELNTREAGDSNKAPASNSNGQ